MENTDTAAQQPSQNSRTFFTFLSETMRETMSLLWLTVWLDFKQSLI